MLHQTRIILLDNTPVPPDHDTIRIQELLAKKRSAIGQPPHALGPEFSPIDGYSTTAWVPLKAWCYLESWTVGL
jgi:hypothetical protein